MQLDESLYVCAIQLDALAPVVLIAGMTPEALHLCLVDGRGVIHLHAYEHSLSAVLDLQQSSADSVQTLLPLTTELLDNKQA